MKRMLSTLCVPVLVTGSVVATAVPANAGLPSGTTPVPVTSGVVTTGIDASVVPLGAITGKITSVATGGAVDEAEVLAIGKYGRVLTRTYSGEGSRGSYVLRGLAPGDGYRVCVLGRSGRGGGSVTGYLSQCYQSDAWAGRGAPPADAQPVSVSAGATTTGIDVALPDAAAIAGTVSNRGGLALAHVEVLAVNRSTGERFRDGTNRAGRYRVRSLTPAADGYTVCFAGQGVRSPTGYLDECWKNQPWSGRRIPTDTMPVSVRLGRTHSGISPVLAAAGAIAGRLTDAVTGDPVFGGIAVFRSSGRLVAKAYTGLTGHYVAKGLRAARRDYVCADGEFLSPTTRYQGKCYRNVAWSGSSLPDSGLTGVGVRLGEVHHGISLALRRKTVTRPTTGSITGVITSGVDDVTPLRRAIVIVYGARGAFAGYATTSASGAYTVGGLRPNSTGYIVCARADAVSAPTPPTGGWAPHCFRDATWDGGNRLPGSAVKVALTAGQAKVGIDITLPVGGAIAGHVTVSGTTDLAPVMVQVFNSISGQWVSAGGTRSDGSYKIRGLTPGSYTVCFDGRLWTDPPTPFGSQPQCYDNVRWNAPAISGD
jgi:hypothetical protein